MKKIDLKLVSVILGFAATLMIFFPALSANDASDTFTGLQIVFGQSFVEFGEIGSSEIQFSFLNLIAFILPALAALALLFMKSGELVSTVIFGVATVMLFLVTEFTVVTVTILSNVNEIAVDWHYAIGLIVAIVLSIVGFIIGLYRTTQ